MLLRLLSTSISASFLILAVIALRAVCSRVPRWMICLLWALVALRLACPFPVRSPLSLLPDSAPVAESIVSAAAPVFPRSTGGETADVPAGPAATAQADAPSPAPGHDIVFYGTVLWLAGAAAMLLYGAVGYLRLRRTVAASACVKGNIWICDWIDAPFILGILRPRIYLPSSMDRDQLPYVLAHEHAHLARRDHWWKPLGYLLLAVYWFHPLVWAAYILLCRDIELACDERVVRDMKRWEKKVYSEILLNCGTAGSGASVCPVAFGGVGVKARVKRVLRYRRPALGTVLGVGAAALVLAACFLTDPQQAIAADGGDDAGPSPSPVVHVVAPESIEARADADGPAETEDLPVLILYDGQLYTGVDPKSIGSVGPGRAVGQIAGVVARDQIPTRELETNNQALVGARVLYDDRYDHTLFVENPDGPSLYSYFVPYYPERIAALEADKAAVEESEESFAAMLARNEALGREALTYEEFARQYAQELIPLDSAPAGYKNLGLVFVTAPFGEEAPGQVFLAEPIITQVLYSWEERSAITVTQNDTGGGDTSPYFVYSDTDETGRPLAGNFWFSYQAGYYGDTGGRSVTMGMECAHGMAPKDCWLIFRSLWPEG